MKTIHIENSFFTANREKLKGMLRPNSIAVINSNDIYPTNADGIMRFKQNNDLFYLTGITQEKTSLLLYPDCNDPNMREILFIRDHDADLETWEGSKLNVSQAQSISGVNKVMPNSRMLDMFHDLMCDAENVYLNQNEHDRAHVEIRTRDDRFVEFCKSNYPLHNFLRLAPLVYSLRMIKSDVELMLIREACNVTGNGFSRLLKFVKPGVMEYEVQAELVHEYMKSGYDIADYEPIVASGINACALHYVANNKECNSGELLLIDAAAGCGPYNADMTRTIPVDGKFNARQRKIYDAVLRVFKGCKKEFKPGRKMKEISMLTRELIAKELIDLKLISKDDIKNLENKSPNFKKYYPHDVSHFIGLDVHDVGNFNLPLQPGMVLTVEPGIYVKEESIGVRIENDIMITKDGSIDLMEGVPIEAGDIEDAMNSK